MPPDTSTSLVNLGKLSKPADTLIKKISSAAGILYEPHHIERVAKAEAKAALLPKKFSVLYYGRALVLKIPLDADNTLDIGKILLTRIGQELAPIEF